jgi:hypothetical protein
MKLAELQYALRAADPAAVLVSPRVLERVIQEVYGLPTLLWRVPHAKSCVVDRQMLFRHVEQEELDLESDRLLPATVVLLRRPTTEELNTHEPGDLLLKYWRRLFHANVHLELANRQAAGKLGTDDVGTRVAQLGRTEFAEICTVLVQEGYLPAQADEPAVYTEFAAVYLELRHFAPGLLPAYFPAIDDLRRVEALLAQDLDATELLARTRLPGAPDPAAQAVERSDEAHEFYWKLMKAAAHKARAGNLVQAAILRTRAGRVAPAALAFGTRAEAQADLQKLMTRLQAALQLSNEEAAEWMKDLPALLDKADQGSAPVEAALLYDLQWVCLDHERDIYALDLPEWLLTAGRRPIKRPLPGQRLVRVTRHLRSAAQRLTLARLSDMDRQHLAGLLEGAVHHAEQGVMARFRPVLTTALQDVGLQPTNPIERTAFQKMIEELLQRINALGFLTFGDLRDAISRNQLKLTDLADPQQFVRGDPLLRLDRRLATLLDGIYRPSTFYMRLLERFTALNFGTATGRWITRFVTVPCGGALLLWEGVKVVLHEVGAPAPPEAVGWAVWLALAVFLLGLLQSARLRRGCLRLATLALIPLRGVFVDGPLWLVRWPALRRAVASWPFQLFYWYLFKPLLVCALLWLVRPDAFEKLWRAAGIFLLVNVLLNTRAGHAAQEMLRKVLAGFVDLLRAGLLPGLVRLIIYVFKRATELVEAMLFSVDEWFRFRSDTGPAALATRAVLGVLWYPVSYVIRFYLMVLIEPGYNPVKAPVSYLAAKLMAPLTLWELSRLTTVAQEWELPVWFLVYPLAFVTIFHLPDVFGFLFWEMKENWSLYRANRPRVLRPVAVGSHGETVRRLLQPGFHSGTIPRLYARLRRAEQGALETGNRRDVRAVRHALRETAGAITLFVSGELVSLVRQASSWQCVGLGVGRVALTSNRIRVALNHAGYMGTPVRLEFEVIAGWLVAGIGDPGWLGRLSAEQARALTTALASLYKLAGVDLVREQLRENLPPACVTYDLTPEGLVLWRERRLGSGAVYALRDRDGLLRPQPLGGAADWPVLDAKRLVFADVSLTWEQCVRCWEQDRSGTGHPSLLGPEVQLLPPSAAAVPAPGANGAARGETASVPDQTTVTRGDKR